MTPVELRRETTAIDRNLPLANVTTLDEALDSTVAAERFSMLMLGIFAGRTAAGSTKLIYPSNLLRDQPGIPRHFPGAWAVPLAIAERDILLAWTCASNWATLTSTSSTYW